MRWFRKLYMHLTAYIAVKNALKFAVNWLHSGQRQRIISFWDNILAEITIILNTEHKVKQTNWEPFHKWFHVNPGDCIMFLSVSNSFNVFHEVSPELIEALHIYTSIWPSTFYIYALHILHIWVLITPKYNTIMHDVC